MVAADSFSAPPPIFTAQDALTVGRRVRVACKAATIRWGPGALSKPGASPPAAVSPCVGEGYSAAVAREPAAATAAATADAVLVVGIEYDEPGNGKHDGSYQGEQLFKCEHGMGSFVKVEKVEVGISIQQALAAKYFEISGPAATKGMRAETVDAVEYTSTTGQTKEMFIEFVGRYDTEQRQKRLEGFVEVALADSSLAGRYPENVWSGDWSLPNTKALWLDCTLIDDWADVIAFCELCPQLDWLSLTRCRLASPPATPSAPRFAPNVDPCRERLCLSAFECRVKTLVLNHTMVSWGDLITLDAQGLFPLLEKLHLANNNLREGIPELDASRPLPLRRIRSLVLDGNEISDWRVISRAIRAFPTLESLALNDNHLGETLEGLAEIAADQTPRRLTRLCLNGNRLSTWGAVGALADYALLELKLQKNNMTEGASAVASPLLLRQVLIGLMPACLRLNASEVTVKERTAAERQFLGLVRLGGPVIEALGATCNLAEHTARLRRVHGEIAGGDVTEAAQAGRSALVNAVVEVTLRPIGAAILGQEQVRKRVPHSMKVAELKRLAQLLFKKVPLERIQLILGEPGMPFGFTLDDEDRELGFYGVSDGAEFRVDDIADSDGTKRSGK